MLNGPSPPTTSIPSSLRSITLIRPTLGSQSTTQPSTPVMEGSISGATGMKFPTPRKPPSVRSLMRASRVPNASAPTLLPPTTIAVFQSTGSREASRPKDWPSVESAISVIAMMTSG